MKCVKRLFGGFGVLKIYNLKNADEGREWLRRVVGGQREDAIWAVKTANGGASAGVRLIKGHHAFDASLENFQENAAGSVFAQLIAYWQDHGGLAARDGLSEAALGWKLMQLLQDPEYADYVPLKAVAQQHITRPLLLGGSKFHLRLYLLVTRYPPEPRVYLARDGFAFVSEKRYDHVLTNPNDAIFSVVGDGVARSAPLDELRQALAATGVEWAPVWASIKEVSRRLVAAYDSALHVPDAPPPPHARNGSCFDLFGLDIMLDVDRIPYILEVNAGPNMFINSAHPEQAAAKAGIVQALAAYTAARVTARDGAAGELSEIAERLTLQPAFEALLVPE